MLFWNERNGSQYDKIYPKSCNPWQWWQTLRTWPQTLFILLPRSRKTKRCGPEKWLRSEKWLGSESSRSENLWLFKRRLKIASVKSLPFAITIHFYKNTSKFRLRFFCWHWVCITQTVKWERHSLQDNSFSPFPCPHWPLARLVSGGFLCCIYAPHSCNLKGAQNLLRKHEKEAASK